MKILHTVEFYYPSIGGAQEVMRQISERLVQLGHDVTVATTRLKDRDFLIYNGVKIKEFDISGNMVRGISGEIDEYQNFLFESDFDIITNYAAQQWATDLVFPILDKITAKKVFVPCGFSGLYLPEYSEYFEQMKFWIKQYDICIYASNNYKDINFARKYGANNNILIPNGAGKDEFNQELNIDIKRKLDIPNNHFLILHVGSHTGVKGHKEAIKIFKKAKIKSATFLIVAKNLNCNCTKNCFRSAKFFNYNPISRLSDKKIVIKSLSRQETVSAYYKADLFLLPSNIECSPIVLFESMASKTPFLTTDVGNAKEIIEWSNGGELLPTIKFANGYVKADVKASTKVLEQLFYDSERRKSMVINGYKEWKNLFTWEKITKQYENLYIKLLSNNKNKNISEVTK